VVVLFHHYEERSGLLSAAGERTNQNPEPENLL